jgi:hypothetical protein
MPAHSSQLYCRCERSKVLKGRHLSMTVTVRWSLGVTRSPMLFNQQSASPEGGAPWWVA